MLFVCLIDSPLQMMRNVLYFVLKAFFRSQDIWVFITTFWSSRKNSLIRKKRLTSKFMTSQPGLQTMAIHILFNISQSQDNHTMKLVQLIKYNKRNIFLQKSCGKWGRETIPDLFYFLKKLNMRSKQVVCSLVSIYCNSPQLAIQ